MESQVIDDVEPIYIEGNVVSSKNGRIYNSKTKRSFPSKNAQQYLKNTKQQYKDNLQAFLRMLEGKQKPYIIGFHFVRKSRHRSDFHNLIQYPLDIMVSLGYLDDDDMENMFAVPLKINKKFYSYDPDDPGVYIKVL